MSNRVDIEVDEFTLKRLVRSYIEDKLSDVSVSSELIKIEVKSKQNCNSEWEEAAFRARVTVDLDV